MPRIKYEGEKTVKKANDYLNSCVDSWEKTRQGVRLTNSVTVRLPKMEGLALYLEVSRQAIYDWVKEYPDFAEVVERMNCMQVDRVINESLAGNYNSNIAKLLLGKHGYKEASEVDHGVTDDLKEFLAKTKSLLNE